MRSVLLLVAFSFVSVAGAVCSPAQAQSYPQDTQDVQPQPPLQGMTQIDITGGLADRSAQYAMQHVPYQPPQAGYPPQMMPGQPQPMAQPPMPPYPGQPAYAPAGPAYAGYPPQYQASPYGPPAQPYPPQPYPPQQYGAPPPYGQYQYPVSQQMAPPPQQGWAQQPQQQQQSSGNPKLMTQAIGALGAATMLNYMTTGGMDTVLSPLKAHGWNSKFHTYGSCIGGNISPP